LLLRQSQGDSKSILDKFTLSGSIYPQEIEVSHNYKSLIIRVFLLNNIKMKLNFKLGLKEL